MMKVPIIRRRNLVLGLAVLLVLQSIATVYLLVKSNSLNSRLATTKSDVAGLKGDTDFKNRMLYNEIDNQKSLLTPVVLPKENTVAIPELKISLPYNAVTRTLQYWVDDYGNNIRLTSTLLIDHEARQMSCNELVRINTKAATPYNPWEEAMGSVTLSDGRTIHLIGLKAFKNNEASTEDCAKSVWIDITPQKVADELKKAKAY